MNHLCTRCEVNPRLPKQRWCRSCLSQAQRERRAAQHASPAEGASTTVTQAKTHAIPCVTPVPDPGLPEAQRQALEAYQNAVQEYEAKRQIDRGWMPTDRSSLLVPLWRKVEEAKRRCLVLGVDPERDRR